MLHIQNAKESKTHVRRAMQSSAGRKPTLKQVEHSGSLMRHEGKPEKKTGRPKLTIVFRLFQLGFEPSARTSHVLSCSVPSRPVQSSPVLIMRSQVSSPSLRPPASSKLTESEVLRPCLGGRGPHRT